MQEYLQGHYIRAVTVLAAHMADRYNLTNVIGFGPMNEPLPGYIGNEDLAKNNFRLVWHVIDRDRCHVDRY